jgi:hypothetical protein
MTLLVMVPTRQRRENCERFLKSFEEMTDDADLVFITDSDDQDSYKDMDWGSALHAVLEPREPTVSKVNRTADACASSYDALMFIGDDNTFATPHWDTILMKVLTEDMDGTGMVYPDDKRRNDIPETIIISSDIVMHLGYFMNPGFAHYYVDNVWAEMGKRSGLIRFCPQVVVDHKHYSIDPDTPHDETYTFAEKAWGRSDHMAFQKWRAVDMPAEVSKLRRKFNPDIKWVLDQF